MTILPVRPPYLIRRYYSDFIWRMPDDDRKVYLTFDDGPIPEVTEFVLDVLKSEGIAATFFCIGDNVEKHPEIFRRIVSEGHSVGNHTYNHLNGWNTPVKPYIDNVLKAGAVIDTTLFRPPYGRIRKEQADAVSIRYKIVMWDVLSYDFDANITPQRCLKNVLENTRPGSVIVFHDSLKARRNMEYAFPETVKKLKEAGFGFGSLK